MLVGFDGKRLESSLVDVSHTDGAVMDVPTKRVGDGQPAKEFGHLLMLTLLGPDDKVPVVAHQRVAEDSKRNTLESLGQDVPRKRRSPPSS